MSRGYVPAVTAEQRAHREQAQQERLTEVFARLRQEVQQLRSGQQWQRWLAVAARLPSYSLRNQLLIAQQFPTATTVAGYTAWQQLGRQVDKGQKGIQILAPVVRRSRSNPTVAAAGPVDPAGGQPVEAQGTSPRVAGWKVTHVWDVSQTSGQPLATQPPAQLLLGTAAPGLWDALHAAASARGFTVERGDCGTANGETHHAARRVRVRADVEDAQAVKTLAHELAHVLLHDPMQVDLTDGDAPPAWFRHRGHAEVEAESVAFLLCTACGMDTEGYSFPYVTGWAAGPDGTADVDDVLAASAERVLAAAAALLAELDVAEATPATDPRAAGMQVSAERSADQAASRRRDAVTIAPAAPAAGAVAPTGAAGRRRTPVDGDTARLLAALEQAALLYAEHGAGDSAEAAAARQVLHERGVGAEQAERYRIGVAPLSWNSTVDLLRAAGHVGDVLLAAGIATRTSRGTLVDRMRGRLVFPVLDHDGKHVLGFVGRDLGMHRTTAKYLNTPTTSLYCKGEVLYGLGTASRALVAGAVPVLVEGPFDALAIERVDAGHVGVAAVGTAVTAGHVRALRGHLPPGGEPAVLVGFDGDAAGLRAALSVYPLLRDTGAWPLHVQLPAGEDPASLGVNNPGRLRSALADARQRPLSDAVLAAALRPWRDRLHWAEGQVGAARVGARVVIGVPPCHAARQLQQLADAVGDTALATRSAVQALDESDPTQPRPRYPASPTRSRGTPPCPSEGTARNRS